MSPKDPQFPGRAQAAKCMMVMVVSGGLLALASRAGGSSARPVGLAACGENVDVEHGFQVRCRDEKTRVAASRSLALKGQHTHVKHAHREWCDRWCVIEKTNADCSSCVQPSFPGYMARMKASERLSREGWGIHIPSNDELRIQDAARHLGDKGVDDSSASGHDKARSESPLLGSISPEAQAVAGHAIFDDAAGNMQVLHQVKTGLVAMDGLEASEHADEQRLLRDEQRLAHDRAIKQRLLERRREQRREAQTRHRNLAAFLASRQWHDADAKAVSSFKASRSAIRRSVDDNVDPRKAPMLAVRLGNRKKLPKLNLASQYVLPESFSDGLPEPISIGSASEGAAAASAPLGAQPDKAGLAGCHNAFDCFGSLFEGKDLDKGSRFDRRPSARTHNLHEDPRAFIKGQGLGCHSLGGCLGSFFQGQPSKTAKAGKVGLSKALGKKALAKAKVNLDGWNTGQFTKGIENGMNIWEPDQKDALLQVGQWPSPRIQLVQIGDGADGSRGFLDDEAVPQEMGDAPAASCCGGDAVPPIAALGHGVWHLGQDIKEAEVWEPLRAGLQGVVPFQEPEPVIKTGAQGLEPPSLPQDPTGTGRFE